jgi:hypothetical protein
MATPNNSPRDLARLVYASLRDARFPPSMDVLEELFQVLFLVSLEKEESVSPRCAVAFTSPKRPDPDPPMRIRSHRWTYIPFKSPVTLTVSSLTKLAVAAHPDLSSFAVYPNRRGELEISGMFDQQAGFKGLMRYESTSGGFDPPGLFQAEINGLGHIIVTEGRRILGELNAGKLVSESQDVFGAGPVRRALAASVEQFRRLVRAIAAENEYPIGQDEEADVYMGEIWVNTLRRLLLRARAQRHGGAFLINPNRSLKHLRVKHSLKYDRVGRLLALKTGHGFVEHGALDVLHDEYMETDSETMPLALYFDERNADGESEDAEEALSGAIGFVASLSRMDGLVLMNSDFTVRGFGVEITAPEMNLEVVTVPNGRMTRGRKVHLEGFGTRHRSMFRYCAAHPGSVGFVLSEDGPVRAVLRHTNRVLLWENIQLTMAENGDSA